jgi:cobalt-zinc-cadmium efflux system protein
MDHDHDHAGGLDAATDRADRRARRLWLALGLNLVIVVVQVVAAFAASSLGLIADAGHNLTDVAAVAASLVAVRMARRPPTAARSFGFYRGTILAAQFNAALILVLTVWLVFEAVERLRTPEPVEGGIVLVVALVAAAANGLAALVLLEGGHTHADVSRENHAHERDLSMRSALLHTVGDAAASLGVAVAGAIMLIVGGWYWLDPVTSLVIGALIAIQAWKLLRVTTAVLLEGTPEGLDLAALASLMAKVAGVDSVHDLHVWSLSTEVRALSAHLVLSGHPSLEEAQATGRRVKDAIRQPFDIAHATLELECESCDTDGDPCEFEGLTVRVTRPADSA